MRLTGLSCCLLLAVAMLSQSVTRAAVPAPLGLQLHPCVQGKAKAPAQCGTFRVYENREAQSGRVIALNVIVLKAKHRSRGAIAEIAGGPGEAATQFAGFLVDGELGKAPLALHDDYDFIFMDDRGMGKSNAFPCDLAPPNDPASYFKELFPHALVAACREKSIPTHDLPRYDTNNAVDDLDDVRAALGYGKIILDGGSYGTMFSLVYMRRHPEHVESAVLDAVAPPGFMPVPGEPMGAQVALDGLIQKCKSDAKCNANFPDFAQHFTALLKRFDAGPVEVPVHNAEAKKMQTVELSKEVFVDQLRHVLYNPFASAYIPYVVERAYGGDYAPLGAMVNTVSLGFASDLNMAAYLVYSCSDMMPFITPEQLREAREHSFASDLRYRAQQQACAILNVPPMPAAFNEPVRSSAPVLMILGTDDPATPPKYGEAALRYLPNGRAVLVKGGAHGADTPCTDKLEIAFIHAGSAKALDVSRCTATFKLPPFATSMKGWP